MAAFGHDPGGCRGIDRAVVAQMIGTTEDTILSPRDEVHERRVIANNRAGEFHLWPNCDLAAMRFKIQVLHQRPRTDSSAIDNEIELRIDLFQFGKTSV